jgi:hypothetical protein
MSLSHLLHLLHLFHLLHLSYACAHGIKTCKIQQSDCLRTLWDFFGGSEIMPDVFLHNICEWIFWLLIFIVLSQNRNEKQGSFTMVRCGSSRSYNTQHTTHNKMSHCCSTLRGFALYLHGNICHGPKSWSKPQLLMSLFETPGRWFVLTAAGSLGWDTKLRCIDK